MTAAPRQNIREITGFDFSAYRIVTKPRGYHLII